jgi:predicted XRE-type DNA-binding protein
MATNLLSKSVISQLKKWKKQNRLTQAEMGKKCGVHQSEISRILAGEIQTMSKNVIKICKKAGIKLHEESQAKHSMMGLLDEYGSGSIAEQKAVTKLLKAIRFLVQASSAKARSRKGVD